MNNFKYYFENNLHYIKDNKIYLIDNQNLILKYKLGKIYNKHININLNKYDVDIPIIINKNEKTITINYYQYTHSIFIPIDYIFKDNIIQEINKDYKQFSEYNININYNFFKYE